MGRKLFATRQSAIVLLIVVGLVLLGALLNYTGDNLPDAEKRNANNESSGMTESQNRGWKWAEKGRVKTAVQCEELKDPDERSGCEAYVIFVSAQNATSP